MFRRLIACLTLLLALMAPRPAAAQTLATITSGLPARLGLQCAPAASCETYRGTVLGATADSVTLKTGDDAVLALARDEIAWMEVRSGRSGARKGAFIGGGVGLGAGLLLGAGLCSTFGGDEEGSCFAGSLGVAIFNGAVFAGIGALIGAVAAPAKWSAVPPSTVQVAVRSLPDSRIGLGVSLPLGGFRRRTAAR